MQKNPLLFSAVLIGLLVMGQPVFAATSANTSTTTSAQTAEDVGTFLNSIENANPIYEQMTVNQPTKPLSGLGHFWRTMQERFILAMTFNPVKKAEKALQFSEERMLLAEKALESSDSKLKERAQEQLERAQELMKKAKENQEKSLKNPSKDAERLLKNLAAGAERQHDIFDRLEKNAKGDDADRLLEARQKITEGNERLENAIKNENIPAEIRDHLKEVKDRIETHADEVKSRVEETKKLKDAAKDGDDEALAKLKTLKAKRQEDIKKSMTDKEAELQAIQKKIAELKIAAAKGDAAAIELLKKLEAMPGLQNRLDDIENKIEDRRQERERERSAEQEDEQEDEDTNDDDSSNN